MIGRMIRTYWLVFSDPDEPEEDQFKGVCVVDVDDAEAAAEKRDIDVSFPLHADGAEWVGAAIRKAWEVGCNPGGQVGVDQIPSTSPIPRNRFLTERELKLWTGEWVQ